MYVDGGTLRSALGRLYGTAGHLLKIWLTLKHMGLNPGAPPVEIDTSNSTSSLQKVATGPVSGVDGVEVSVIFDFGVGAIDWRGAWFNPGT